MNQTASARDENGASVSGAHPCPCNRLPEWSGSPNPSNPDNEWLHDECGGVVAVEASL